jgi:ATP-dependent helicase HepA
VQEKIPLRHLRPVSLPPQTRCYFQLDGRWTAGRIGRNEGDQYEVDLPNGRAQYLPESFLHVRTNLPIADPTSVLAIKAHESASYFGPRSEYLHSIYQQGAACRGLAGVLSARITLLPHQLQTVRRVVEDPIQRYLLADEVGLGKTIEAGCVLRQYLIDNPGGRVLLLVPGLLRDQWEQELDEKFDSNGLDGDIIIESPEEIRDAADYDSLGLVIVDEAQHVAAWAFAAEIRIRRNFARLEKLTTQVPRLLLLSATPVLHNERDFLAMLHLLSPDVYSLDDLDRFRMRVAARQEFGRALVGLQADRPAFLLRSKAHELRELLPTDAVLSSRLDRLESVLDSEADQDVRATVIREIRTHISESYRLHHRMLRNRRSKIAPGVLVPRGLTAGGKAMGLEEWDSDERSELAQDSVDRWRLAARECLDEESATQREAALKAVFLLLLQAASSHPTLFGTVARARLDARPNRGLLQEFESAAWLWTARPFNGESELLREMVVIAERHSEADRIDDLIQLLRSRRLREGGKKFVVFTGYTSICSLIFERMSQLPDFAACRAYHAGVSREEIEDILAEFRDPDSKADVLVCDRAGEEGRNLQFADCVIHFDLPWNPNRLEQRIGRLDRIGRATPLGSRVFVGPDAEDTLADAWYCTLRDGFEIFKQSIASLQMFVDRAMPELVDIAWQQGASGLLAHIPILKCQIAEEMEHITEQDILDEVESLESDASPWVEDLLRMDDKAVKIQKSTEAWIVGKLHFKKRWSEDKLNVCTYKPSVYGTHVPFDLIYEDFAYVLLEPVTYFRDAAVRYPGIQLLRIGSMFIDRMTQFIRWDDRGQAFAFWRKVPGWEGDELWSGFVFTLIIGPDLREASQIARQIYGLPDLSGLRRRAEAWFPQTLEQVFVDSHAEPVADPELLAVLRRPYQDYGATADVDLFGARSTAISEIVDPARWESVCHDARSSAQMFLMSGDKVQESIRNSTERGTRELTQRLNTLKVRAGYARTEDEKLTRGFDLDMEQEVGAAILRGIASPAVRVDAAGFIVLSGRDCPVEDL